MSNVNIKLSRAAPAILVTPFPAKLSNDFAGVLPHLLCPLAAIPRHHLSLELSDNAS